MSGLAVTADFASAGTVTKVSGTKADSGDNSIVSALANRRFVLTKVTLQNESSTATTILLKIGTNTIERVLAQNQGDGIAVAYPPDARPSGANNEAILINLSGANSCGYTIHYLTV